MKLKNACVLGLSLILLLTGCDHKDTPDDDTTIDDGGNTGDTTDKSNFDVDLPNEIPTLFKFIIKEPIRNMHLGHYGYGLLVLMVQNMILIIARVNS